MQKFRRGIASLLSLCVLANHSAMASAHPPTGPSRNTVIVVQDVHANEEAQRSISDLIKELSKKKILDYVAVEGCSSRVPLERYRRGPADVLESAADFLLEKGKISGAVYAGLTMEERPPLMIGVEDEDLYQKNVAAFQAVSGQTKKLAATYASEENRLTLLSREFFNEPLAAFDDAFRRYTDHAIPLQDYLQELAKHQSLSLELEKYRVAVEMEEAMDLGKDYLALARGLDGAILFQDIRRHEVDTYDKLARTQKERDWVDQLRLARLRTKLVSFSLTAEEWEEYQKFKTSDELRFCEEFYSAARQRDEFMARRVIEKFGGRSSQTGVLVVGGFHAKAIASALNNAGFTTIMFVPRFKTISGKDGGTEYLSVFAQEKTPLEKLAMGEKIFLAQDPGVGLPLLPYLRAIIHRGLRLIGPRSNVTVGMDFPSREGNVHVTAELERNKEKAGAAPRLLSLNQEAIAAMGLAPAEASWGTADYFQMALVIGIGLVIGRLVQSVLQWIKESRKIPSGAEIKAVLEKKKDQPAKRRAVVRHEEALEEIKEEFVDVKASAHVVQETKNGREQVYKVIYKSPSARESSRDVLRVLRFRYFDSHDPNPAWYGLARRKTVTTVDLSQGVAAKFSYEYFYDDRGRLLEMRERPSSTLFGYFSDSDQPGEAYDLVIANKSKPGEDREVKAIVRVSKQTGGKVELKIFTKLVRSHIKKQWIYAVAEDAVPSTKQIEFLPDESLLFREVFNAACRGLKGSAFETEVTFFGDYDDQHRPRWQITTDVNKDESVVKSVVFLEYRADGRTVETVRNLTNGHASSPWKAEIKEMTVDQIRATFALRPELWNQRRVFAPLLDPNNLMARHLEEATIQKISPQGVVLARRNETYATTLSLIQPKEKKQSGGEIVETEQEREEDATAEPAPQISDDEFFAPEVKTTSPAPSWLVKLRSLFRGTPLVLLLFFLPSFSPALPAAAPVEVPALDNMALPVPDLELLIKGHRVSRRSA